MRQREDPDGARDVSSTDPSNRGSWLAGILLLALACLSLFGDAAGAAAQVPANGRAWELVTPGEAINSKIDRPVGITFNGDRVAYQTWGSMPGAAAGELFATNVAARTASGWESTPLSVPIEVPIASSEYLLSPLITAFDPGLSETVRASTLPLVPGGPEAPEVGIYRIGGGGIALLASAEGSVEGTFRGASDDLSHVVFRSSAHLLPSDAGRTSGSSIFEWTAGGVRQVDVDTNGSLLSECGSSVAFGDGVSDSGDRIFFTNPDFGCELPKRLYLREDGSTTVEVSASRCTRSDCNAPADAEFREATADGSVVFFATTQQLVNEDDDEFRDLYRYDVESGSLERVSARSPGETGSVTGEVQASADGSRVYFFADGRLLPGLGTESGRNLYVADQTGLRFVAATGEVKPLLVAPSGNVALFSTPATLEGADTDAGFADAYIYEAGPEKLTLASSGGNGPYEVKLRDAVPRGGSVFELRIDAPFGGSLSAVGDRVFFTTAEPLVPEDRNEVADVYEWAGGSVGLLSSGEGEDGAEFEGAASDGRTVFFRTSASLLPEDQDGGDTDIYAARIGGGFPTRRAAGEGGCGSCPGVGAPASRPRVASSAAAVRAAARIRVGRLDRHAGARALADGSLRLPLHLSAPGKVVAKARARLAGGLRTAAQGAAGAVGPGRLTVKLMLSRLARRALRRRGGLSLHLVVRQGDLRLTRRLELVVGAPR